MSVSNSMIRINNNDLIQVTKIDKPAPESISDDLLEKVICKNLSNQTLPINLVSTNTELVNLPVTSGIDGKNLINGVMISNNEEIIDSELMALKFSYNVTDTETILDRNQNIHWFALNNTFTQNITLKPDTRSYVNSILQFDLSYNNDIQKSINNDNSTGDWSISIDRSVLPGDVHSNNYFAAVNSNANTTNNQHPMFITELVNNDFIVNDGRYISNVINTNPISANSTNNQHVYNSFDSSYNLQNNNLTYILDNNHNFTSTDFTMYKLYQPDPTISTISKNNLNVDISASNLPIESINGTDIIVTLSELNTYLRPLSDISRNVIGDQFSVNVSIGNVDQGGFSVAQNNILSLDITTLATDISTLIAAGINNDSIYIDISNGGLILAGTDISSNVDSVSTSDSNETLSSPFNTINGKINIEVADVNSRVNITSDPTLISKINVLYNCDEARVNNVQNKLDDSMMINPVVNFNSTIIVPSTASPNSFNYLNDSRNLKKSNNAALVMCNNLDFTPQYVSSGLSSGITEISNLTFTSYFADYFNDTDILYMTIKNENILTELSQPLLNVNGSEVPNSLTFLSFSNINLSTLDYTSYRVKLDTKLISDLSNSLQPTNGWSVKSINSSNILYTNPIKTSILYDDSLFMTSNIPTTFDFKYSIDTPSVHNTQAIKHRIDISFNDFMFDNNGNVILNNGVPMLNSLKTYVFLDDNEITYSTPSTLTYLEHELSPDEYKKLNTIPVNVSNNFILKKIVKTIQYKVSFDPKLPFYKNVALESPVINELVEYYKIYDLADNEYPDLFLKYFTDINNETLSMVNVSEINNVLSTSISVTPEGCSTLKGVVQGSVSDSNFVNISNTFIVDPFFNTELIIPLIPTGSAKLNVQVSFPTLELSSPSYYVNSSNLHAVFSCDLYKYDTINDSYTNNSFNSFNAYNNLWTTTLQNNTFSNGSSLPIDLIIRSEGDISNNIVTLNVYDSSNHLLVTIIQPTTLISDFNVIRCLNPLLLVTTTIGDINNQLTTITSYSKALNYLNKTIINVADGVNLYTVNDNPLEGTSYSFSLKPDRFSVKFVDDPLYNNNGWETIQDFTNIINGSRSSVSFNNGVLKLQVNSPDSKSIIFNKYRGYNRIIGNDIITVNRNSIIATFVIDTLNNGRYNQIFTFAKNGIHTVNNLVNSNNNVINLGLKINSFVSSLSSINLISRIPLNLTGANITWSDSLGLINGNSNLLDGDFSRLFGWKSRKFISTPFNITVTYTIPKIKYYNLNVSEASNNVLWSGDSVIGDPTGFSQNRWFNETTPNILKVSGITINRTRNFVSGNFIAYLVVTPPQQLLTYNKGINIWSFPFLEDNMNDSFIYLSIVNKSQNQYIIAPNGNNMTLINNNIKSYGYYKSLTNPVKNRFVIEGNYANIRLFIGNTPVDTLFNGKLTDIVNGGSNITVNKVTELVNDRYKSYYNVLYKQLVGISGENLNTRYNVHFTISDAFLSPEPNNLKIQFHLFTLSNTVTSIYQSNVKLINNSYIMEIDKYECNEIDYSAIHSATPLNKIFFVAARHYTVAYSVDGSQLPIHGTNAPFIGDITLGQQFDITDLFSDLTLNDIVFEEDLSFIPRNVGIILSALSSTGINNLLNMVLNTSPTPPLPVSKTFYIYSPDVMRVNSLFGSAIYRVTNYGNVKTPSLTTYAINIAGYNESYGSNSGIQTVINSIPNVPSNRNVYPYF